MSWFYEIRSADTPPSRLQVEPAPGLAKTRWRLCFAGCSLLATRTRRWQPATTPRD